MEAADGKQRLTDCADAEAYLCPPYLLSDLAAMRLHLRHITK